jgi:hypothetical protein
VIDDARHAEALKEHAVEMAAKEELQYTSRLG